MFEESENTADDQIWRVMFPQVQKAVLIQNQMHDDNNWNSKDSASVTPGDNQWVADEHIQLLLIYTLYDKTGLMMLFQSFQFSIFYFLRA